MNHQTSAGLAFIARRGLGALAESMGIVIQEFDIDQAVATMPVRGNTQPVGLVHGGAYVVLGETLGSMMANYYAQVRINPNTLAVGIEVNASHTGSAKTGMLTAVCQPIHLGSTLTTHEISIRNDAEKICSTIRITNLIRSVEH